MTRTHPWLFGLLLSCFPTILGAQPAYEHMRVRVGPHVFEALTAGPTDGELVLLLHGFPETSYTWRHQLGAIARQGFLVIAPDQRGYSPDARPEEVEQYQMRHLVEDVLGMADALGRERFHLVGHDWGGAVAWVTALRRPDRVISLSALSMPHPAAFGRARSDPGSDQARRSAYFQDLSAPDAERRFLENGAARLRAVFDGAGLTEAEVGVYVQALEAPGAMTAALDWYRALTASSGGGGGSNARTRPAEPRPFEVPTLYIWGTDDPAFGPDVAEATADYVAGYYRFEPLEGMGHWLQEQASDRVTELLLEHLQAFRGEEETR
jgi:pimeloyl-ACP methyl ester carboxylesterase